jgi:hypothetical protein
MSKSVTRRQEEPEPDPRDIENSFTTAMGGAGDNGE